MSEYQDDIEKYLNGKLTPAERHKLEKKALSDPFLAEALEGAESITGLEFSQDLSRLHQKINIQKKNTFLWPLRIAAGIIVIISITILSIKLTEDNHQLALQKETPSNSPEQPTPDSDEGTRSISEQQAPAPKTLKDKPSQPVISEKPKSTETEIVTSTDAISSASSPAEKNLEAPPLPKMEIAADKVVQSEAELSRTKETEERKMELDLSKQDRATTAPSTAKSRSLSKKAEAASGASMASDEDMPRAILQNESTLMPTPVGGFLAFNKFVEDNLRYPQPALNNNIQGDVIVEFQINANGSYRNFSIVNSLGFGCDEEAIRLINEGPKWTPIIQDGKVTNNKPRVTIPFRFKRTSN